ncbi:gonadotropin-releasing hormone II receptor-like [Mytilus californianus]|uniref:gonadotropin-releasing hormone II receptor-like n=1 Tax=Mytilus californianus TaxID=6549 RepID=UPI002245C7DE|nr:gonadotropin-releasing hormone II receptor-like [Mytilus californianus]
MIKSDKQCFTWLELNNSTTLHDLNNQFTERHIGGIFFTSVLMVLGIFGNFAVLIIYTQRFKVSNYRTYTIWLAIMDIANACIGMPFLVYYMSHYLTFPSDGLCKFGRFTMVFTTNSSAYILVVIAFDRYRKVCKPLKRQLTSTNTNVCCVSATILGLMTSWPCLVLYGINTADMAIPWVKEIRCWTDDNYIDTDYPKIYYIVLYIFNFLVFPILFVVYVQILRFLHIHGKSGVRVKTKKTTITLLAVSAAFLLSAIPHYSLVVITRFQEDFNCEMTFAEGFVYYTFVFSILLNNSVNPFIYGLLDTKFKREIRSIFQICRKDKRDATSRIATESMELDLKDPMQICVNEHAQSSETNLND